MADVLMAAVLVIDMADCALASAAPFAGMTQTGSMGLISAAQLRGTPSRWHIIANSIAGRKGSAGREWGGRSDRRANEEPSNL